MNQIIVGDSDHIRFDQEKVVSEVSQLQHDQTYYFSSHQINHEYSYPNVYVYHDLIFYKPFHSLRDYVKEESSLKGVFRMRRVLSEFGDPAFVIAADLLALTELFGEVDQFFVKQSKQHWIISVRSVEGTMIHVDYTFGEEHYLALEWSGLKHILEFDQHEMNPFKGSSPFFESFELNAKDLLRNAYPIQTLLDFMERYGWTKLGADQT